MRGMAMIEIGTSTSVLDISLDLDCLGAFGLLTGIV